MNVAQVHLRTKTLHMHQWGVSLPGACEALCHWRGTVEPLVLNGTLEPLVAADLDLVNMFGNAEWPAIRAALRTHFAEASAWTEWQHQSDSVTTLPTGRVFPTDRGAEQGDVLGTIQSALVLGEARETQMQDFLSTPFEQKGVCDEWFVDDGQSFVRPMLFDRWLRALDSALASFGATRGRVALGNAKSSARLLCPPERTHEFSGWDTAYVHDSVVVLSPDAGTTALGTAFGTREQINARAWESVRACDELRSAITGVDHAPTEMVLTRQCADVSKLMYHMRINGDVLDHDLLASFDGQLRASVSNSLCGDLPDHSWWQATTGVSVGGLGLRTAIAVALPAFVASRISSRPLVVTMVDHLCAAIGASRQTIMAEYDTRTDEALSRLASTLPTATALELLTKLDEAHAESYGKTCSRALSQPCGISLALLPATPEASRQMTVTATTNTRTHASAPRFRASSPRASTQAFARACCKCMRERDPGLHARALPSSATRMWTTRGYGGLTHVTARPWKLTSMLIRFDSDWAALGPWNLSPALPATLASWTRARRTPPAAPWAKPHAVTTLSPLSYTQPHNNAITPLRWRYLASSLART